MDACCAVFEFHSHKQRYKYRATVLNDFKEPACIFWSAMLIYSISEEIRQVFMQVVPFQGVPAMHVFLE